MRILITGITGQDGSYLAESLLAKGHEVYGMVRRNSNPNHSNIEKIIHEIRFLSGDLTDQRSLDEVVQEANPDEIYHLASQSNVGTSFRQPTLTMDVTGLGTLRMLEAMRRHAKGARFYQAGTSELFGGCREHPPFSKDWGNKKHGIYNHRNCPFVPISPYAIAKLAAHHAVSTYRQAYGLWAVNGILFNHESPRRGLDFVTRKIVHACAQRKLGKPVRLQLGNLLAVRDWGYAGEYVEAMQLMMKQTDAKDCVIGTGIPATVLDFMVESFKIAGLENDEEGFVELNNDNKRPLETVPLIADTNQQWDMLHWKPKTTWKELVKLMLDEEIRKLLSENGNRTTFEKTVQA